MAVDTPQLDVPVYQPKDTAQAPAQTAQPSQMLPPQAGFVSKAGAGAYLANNVLDGWLKGRAHKQQQELAKAQNNVQGSDYAYQTMARNYNDMLKQGKAETDPEVQKAKQAAVQAWNNKLNVMQQYAVPEEQKGQKKGAKQKAEGFLSQHFGKAGIEPQMIPQAALAMLRSAPPPGLGLTTEDQRNMAQTKTAQAQTGLMETEAKAAQIKLEQETTKAAQDKRITDIVAVPPDHRTPEQREQLDAFQRVQHMNDPEDVKFGDSIMKKIQAGQQLSSTERDFAYSKRLLTAPQVTFRTGSNGMDQVVTLSSDGKVLGTTNLGRHYQPDEVGPARRLLQMKQGMDAQMIDRALPVIEGETKEHRQQRVWAGVAEKNGADLSGIPSFIGNNPQQKEQDMNTLNRALKAVYSGAGGPKADADTRKAEQARMMNFITPGNGTDPASAGMFLFRPQVSGQKYQGGIENQKQASLEQAAIYNQVRAALQQQNKGLTPAELDRILPPSLNGQGQQAMSAPPSGPGFLERVGERGMSNVRGFMQRLTATPDSGPVMGSQGAGKRKYSVTANGTTQQAWMTPEDAKEYTGYGAQVAEIQ